MIHCLLHFIIVHVTNWCCYCSYLQPMFMMHWWVFTTLAAAKSWQVFTMWKWCVHLQFTLKNRCQSQTSVESNKKRMFNKLYSQEYYGSYLGYYWFKILGIVQGTNHSICLNNMTVFTRRQCPPLEYIRRKYRNPYLCHCVIVSDCFWTI